MPTDQGGHLATPIESLRRHHQPSGPRVGLPDQLTHHIHHAGVADRAGGDPARLPGPVGPCGDLAALPAQHPTDRLDRKPLGAHLVDVAHHQRLRGSSSPAKKVAAAFRIATSSRSLRFSAFNRRISSDSWLVTPSRCPASISAWITHRRTDSFPTPTCLATACDAAVNVGYSPRCSLTRRTALAFNSGSIIFGILLILLDSNRSGIKPGAPHGPHGHTYAGSAPKPRSPASPASTPSPPPQATPSGTGSTRAATAASTEHSTWQSSPACAWTLSL